MSISITARDIDFAYRDEKVLEQISLAVDRGSFVGIIGPNGSGKTTFLRILSRVLAPQTGTVLLDGRDVSRIRQKAVAQVLAVVPQETVLTFEFTALEVVRMGRTPHLSRLQMERGEDYAIAREAMERTGVWEFRDKPVTELSGGERQRVIVAQALAQQPRVMLLDEPTLHLDINHQLEVMDLMRKLNREGLTVVAVLHDLNLAAYYCSELVLLSRGSIEAVGCPEKVLTSDMIREVFGAEALVRRHPVTKKLYVYLLPRGEATAPMGGLKVHVICGDGTGAPLMREMVRRGYQVTAGVVNVLDTDQEMAGLIGVPVVAEAPFSSVSDESHARNMELARQADLIVVTNVPFGPANVRNLEAAHSAQQGDVPVVFISETSIAERDYSGGHATKIVQSMVEAGAVVVDSVTEFWSYLGKVVGEKDGKNDGSAGRRA